MKFIYLVEKSQFSGFWIPKIFRWRDFKGFAFHVPYFTIMIGVRI